MWYLYKLDYDIFCHTAGRYVFLIRFRGGFCLSDAKIIIKKFQQLTTRDFLQRITNY